MTPVRPVVRQAGKPRLPRRAGVAAGLVAAAAVVAVILGGCASQAGTAGAAGAAGVDRKAAGAASTQPPRSPSPEPTPTPTSAPVIPVVPLPVGSVPISVTIPALGLQEPLIELGIDPEGAMEVPYDFGDVGWFTGAGKPGGVGPTVIAGHVDSRTGPAVFFRLSELAVGDQVQVTAVDGSVHDYSIYRVESYPKAEFPTIDVFGALPMDELRLITCTGDHDQTTGRYLDNLVLYGAPVAS